MQDPIDVLCQLMLQDGHEPYLYEIRNQTTTTKCRRCGYRLSARVTVEGDVLVPPLQEGRTHPPCRLAPAGPSR